MAAQAIRIEGLSKSFRTLRGRVPVLKDIDLEIAPGELFVLLGPSGCGKSTLLNLIAGLDHPTQGAIRLGDQTVADTGRRVFVEPLGRDVAMVFQNYALYPHMSVADNIAFPLTNRKPKPARDEIRDRVLRTAETLHIGALLDRKPAELSGGQRQRVAIGRALVREPRLLLMDEPLSNLDARLRVEMRAQLKELQRSLGITTVYVTHDQIEAMTLGDRIAVLNEGRIQQCGAPLEVYDRPANVFVARFVGSPPMNLLPGRLTEQSGRLRFHIADAALPVPTEEEPRLRGSLDQDLLLGIRPEHVDLVEPDRGHANARVRVIESLGSGFLVHASIAEVEVLALSSHRPEGDRVGVRLQLDRVRFFPVSSPQ